MLNNEILEDYRAFARRTQERLAELEAELAAAETKKGLDLQQHAAESSPFGRLQSDCSQ